MSYKDMIVRYNKFRPSADNVRFGEAKTNKSGQGRSVRLDYENHALYIQTQRLRNPFGFSRGQENTPQYNKKFTCTLSFDLKSADGKGFRQAMEDLQDLVAAEAYKNRVEWGLGRNASEARDLTEKEVRRMMTPIVKVPIDKKTGEPSTEYAPTFRVTFNTRNNEETGEVESITSEVYNQDGERLTTVDESTIKAGSNAKVLMYARSVWVTPTGFGINWRVHQMKVYPGTGLPVGKCLMDDDDEDDDGTPVNDEEEGGDEERGGDEEVARPKRLSLRARDN